MHNSDNEVSKADQKRHLIEQSLAKLAVDDPNLYYAPTAEVARTVHLYLKEHNNYFSPEDQALIRHLTIEEVAMLLGFHEG